MVKKNFRRRIQRLLRKPKFLRHRKAILKFKTFAMICFVGNSKSINNPNQESIVVEIFNWAVNLMHKYFQKLVKWLLSRFAKVTEALIFLFRYHPYFTMFGLCMSIALLMLSKRLKDTHNPILEWLKQKLKGV